MQPSGADAGGSGQFRSFQKPPLKISPNMVTSN